MSLTRPSGRPKKPAPDHAHRVEASSTTLARLRAASGDPGANTVRPPHDWQPVSKEYNKGRFTWRQMRCLRCGARDEVRGDHKPVQDGACGVGLMGHIHDYGDTDLIEMTYNGVPSVVRHQQCLGCSDRRTVVTPRLVVGGALWAK